MNSFFGTIAEKKKVVPLFIAFMLLYATSYFQKVAIPGSIFNSLSEQGLTAYEIAGLGTAFTCVYAVCQLIVGILADKFCGTRVILVGGALFCVGVVIFPFTSTLPNMYLARILTALGASSIYLSLLKEFDRLFGRQNYVILVGINYYIGYAGGLFGTLPFSRICEQVGDWRKPLMIAGIISLALYVITLLESRKAELPPIGEKGLSLRPLLGLLRNKFTWFTMSCNMVNFGCYFTIQTVFGKKFLMDFSNLSDSSAQFTILCLTLVTMTALLLVGILSKLIGNRRRPLMISSSFLAFLNTIFMYFAVRNHLPAPAIITGYMLYAVSSGLSLGHTLACQELNSRDTLAQSAGLTNMAGYLGSALSQPLIGSLLEHFVDSTTRIAGEAVVYPQEAYQLLFALLVIPTALSFFITFLIPETKGHYLHLRAVSR